MFNVASFNGCEKMRFSSVCVLCLLKLIGWIFWSEEGSGSFFCM
jgi:hypothetical protein